MRPKRFLYLVCILNRLPSILDSILQHINVDNDFRLLELHYFDLKRLKQTSM